MTESYARIASDPDIFMVMVPFPGTSSTATNCYLVHDAGEWLLVDTGAPSRHGAAVLNGALDELGVDRERLSIFLTHLHFDHAGLVGATGFGGAVYVNEADYRINERESTKFCGWVCVDRLRADAFPEDEVDAAIRQVKGLNMRDLPKDRVAFVRDGDTVVVGGCRLAVVATSGHTLGHQSLFEPRGRHLLGGDHVLHALSPCIDLFEEGGSYQAYLDSLQRVKGLLPFSLLQGHGPLRGGEAERIDWLIAHHEERLCEAERLLRACPAPQHGCEVIKRMSWNVGGRQWADINPVQRMVIAREGAAALDYLIDNGRATVSVSEEGLNLYRALDSSQ